MIGLLLHEHIKKINKKMNKIIALDSESELQDL